MLNEGDENKQNFDRRNYRRRCIISIGMGNLWNVVNGLLNSALQSMHEQTNAGHDLVVDDFIQSCLGIPVGNDI